MGRKVGVAFFGLAWLWLSCGGSTPPPRVTTTPVATESEVKAPPPDPCAGFELPPEPTPAPVVIVEEPRVDLTPVLRRLAPPAPARRSGRLTTVKRERSAEVSGRLPTPVVAMDLMFSSGFSFETYLPSPARESWEARKASQRRMAELLRGRSQVVELLETCDAGACRRACLERKGARFVDDIDALRRRAADDEPALATRLEAVVAAATTGPNERAASLLALGTLRAQALPPSPGENHLTHARLFERARDVAQADSGLRREATLRFVEAAQETSLAPRIEPLLVELLADSDSARVRAYAAYLLATRVDAPERALQGRRELGRWLAGQVPPADVAVADILALGWFVNGERRTDHVLAARAIFDSPGRWERIFRLNPAMREEVAPLLAGAFADLRFDDALVAPSVPRSLVGPVLDLLAEVSAEEGQLEVAEGSWKAVLDLVPDSWEAPSALRGLIEIRARASGDAAVAPLRERLRADYGPGSAWVTAQKSRPAPRPLDEEIDRAWLDASVTLGERQGIEVDEVTRVDRLLEECLGRASSPPVGLTFRVEGVERGDPKIVGISGLPDKSFVRDCLSERAPGFFRSAAAGVRFEVRP